MESVNRDDIVISELVLDAQSELLHVRRVGLIIYDIDSNSEGAKATGEWARKSRTTGVVCRPGRKTSPERAATSRAAESLEGQNSTIQHLLQLGWLQDAPVVVNAIPAADHSFTVPQRIPGKAHARAEVLIFARAFVRSKDVANELAVRIRRVNRGQRRTRFVPVGLPQRVEVYIPTKSEVQRQAWFDAPVVLHKRPQIVVVHKWPGGRTRGVTLQPYGNRNVRIVAGSGNRTRRARQ